MAAVVDAARKVEAALKVDDRAQAKLSKAKKNKRTRKKSLEKLLENAEQSRGALDKARAQLVKAAGIRTENPAPAAPTTLLVTTPDTQPVPMALDVVGATEVFEAMVAHAALITRSATQIVELQAREDNPLKKKRR